MSIKVYDANGEPLERMYQWDVNQTVLVTGLPEAPTVFHFCNTCNDTAYVVSPDTTSDGYEVSVPNILLEDSEPIIMYAYQEMSEDEYVTTFLIHIPVIPRAKPSDYKPSNNVEHYTVASVNARVSRIIQMMTDGDSGDASVEIADMRDINGDGVADYPTAGDALRALALHVSNAGGTNDSEAFAVGQRDGADVGPTDVTYNNNAKYYAQHASENAEAWAKGTRNGSSIPVSDPAYNKHSKFWADKAQTIANSIPSDYSELYRRAMMPFQTQNVSGNPIEITDGADNLPITKLDVNMSLIQNGTGDPSPENVRPITGWTGTTVTRIGLNLIDGVEFAPGGFDDNGNITSNTAYKHTETYIPVAGVSEINFHIMLPSAHAAGVVYHIHGYTEDKTWDSQLKYSIYKLTDIIVDVAIPSDIAYIRFSVHRDDNVEIYADKVDGNFDWSSGGAISAGTLSALNGLLSTTHNHITFDGSTEEWALSDAESENPFYYALISENNIIKEDGNAICSHFVENTNIVDDGENTDVGFRVYYDNTLGGTIFACRPAIASVTDLESWVSWVSAQSETNALQCAFELASAQETQLTPVSVDTFKGYNKVFSTIGTVELAYYIDPSVLVDESLSISGKAADAKVTGDRIDEVESGLGDRIDVVENEVDKNLLIRSRTDTLLSIDDSAGDFALRGISVVVAPHQTGSGTPLLSNVRSILPYSGINIIETGKNLFGGERMGDAIEQAINRDIPTRRGIDGNGSYVTINAANDNLAVFFSSFKANTRYTFIFRLKKSSGVGTNIRVFYTDGSSTAIALPDELVPTNANTIVYHTNRNKSVAYLGTTYGSGTTYLYYNDCGIFEDNDAVIEASDFEAYKERAISYDFETEIPVAGGFYGGILNPTDGKLYITKGYIEEYNGEFIQGGWISNIDSYSAGTFPSIGAEVVYDRAEPTVVNIQPKNVNIYDGTSNWYSIGFYPSSGRTLYPSDVKNTGAITLDYPIKSSVSVGSLESRVSVVEGKTAGKVNSPDNYGTSGQLLASKGDGTTEWKDIAGPSDEQVEDAVNAWIAANPGSVIAIEDGTITLPKLNNSLKAWIRNSFINVKDYGAVGDGATNDKDAIIAAKAALPQDHGVLYFPPGTYIYGSRDEIFMEKTSDTTKKKKIYYIDEHGDEVWNENEHGEWTTDLYEYTGDPISKLWFDGFTNLKVIGDNAIIKVASGSADVPENGLFYFKECKNITVDGLQLDGNRANRPDCGSDSSTMNKRGQLAFYSCENVYVNNVISNNSSMDGITFAAIKESTPNWTRVKNCSVQNCVFDSAYRNGVTIGGVTDFVMSNCVITNAGVSSGLSAGANPKLGIDMEDETWSGAKTNTNVVIKGCYIDGPDGTSGAVTITRYNYNILYTDCVIRGRFGAGQPFTDNVRVINNTFILWCKPVSSSTAQSAINVTSISEFSNNTVIKECTNADASGLHYVLYSVDDDYDRSQTEKYKNGDVDVDIDFVYYYERKKPTLIDHNTFIINSKDIPANVTNCSISLSLNNKHIVFTNNRVSGLVGDQAFLAAGIFSGNTFVIDSSQEQIVTWDKLIPPLSSGVRKFDGNELIIRESIEGSTFDNVSSETYVDKDNVEHIVYYRTYTKNNQEVTEYFRVYDEDFKENYHTEYSRKTISIYIGSDMDLNDCTVTGSYACPVYYSSISHCPATSAFNLIVSETPDGFVTQTLYPSAITGNGAGSYYMRKYDGETFTAWYRIDGVAVL